MHTFALVNWCILALQLFVPAARITARFTAVFASAIGADPTSRYAKLLNFRMLIRIGAIALLATGLSAPAQAQIYSWRDLNGNLVLSNRRPAGVVSRSYAVQSAESVRATRYVAAERGRQYDDLISEHSRRNGIRTDLVRAVM